MYDLLIEDATILSSKGRKVADIAIEDGRIVYVGGRPGGRAKQTLSAIGKFVMPGIVDTHVHFRDPGHPHKETWETGSLAAVSGGVTTVLDMPNTVPPTVDLEALRDKRARAAAASRCHFGLWAGATNDNLDELRRMVDDGAVGIKVFMAESTGDLKVDDDRLEAIFRDTHGLVGVHAEDASLVERSAAAHRSEAAPSHHDVRPGQAAERAVQRVIELVSAHGRTTHVCHVSTAAEVHLLERVRGRLPVTFEVCPHHLFLSTRLEPELGTLIKCNPPIRPELDRKSLWTALRRNIVDSVASDHAPHTLEEKRRPYWEAPAGIPGVETTFSLMMSAVHHGRITLEQMVALLCERPADIFRLEGKGRIAPGADADLVLFTEGRLARLEEQHLLTRAGWSPFVGRELAPKPELVLVAGRPAAVHGRPVADAPRGREVRPADN